MKRCTKCKKKLKLSCFTPNKRTKDGLQHICRTCRNTQRRTPVTAGCTFCGELYTLRRDTWLENLKHNQPFFCVSCRAEAKAKYNRQRTGVNHPNWKGGPEKYQFPWSEANAFYNSKEWKDLRTQVFIRDRYTCQECKQIGGKLEANHIKPRCRYPELALLSYNIETLCKGCHLIKTTASRRNGWIN